MISAMLWIGHGATAKGSKCYCPVLRCERALGDIYACSTQVGEMVCPEKVNREAIRKYAEGEARWSNNSILREYDWALLVGLVFFQGSRLGISVCGGGSIAPIFSESKIPIITTITKPHQRGRGVPARRKGARKAH